MPQHDLLQYVHPDVVWHFEPLSAEDNALTYWNKAAACLVPLDPKLPRSWFPRVFSAWIRRVFRVARQATNRSPDVSRWTREYVSSNQQALDLVHAGIEVGRAQFAVTTGSNAVDAGSWREPFQLMISTAKCLLADARLDDSVRELAKALRFGWLVCNGEVGHIGYMAGHCFRSWALDEIRTFVAAGNVPVGTLRFLIQSIGEHERAGDGLANAMRVDFCWSIGLYFDGMDDRLPVETIVDRMLAQVYFDEPIENDDPERPAPKDGRLEWRRDRVLRLLDSHPRPLNLADSVRRASEIKLLQVNALDGPWKPSKTVQQDAPAVQPLDHSAWPMHLRPSLLYESIGTSDDARLHREQLRCAYSEQQLRELEPPTDAEVEAARVKLRSVDNPVGRVLVEQMAGVEGMLRTFMFTHRARCRGIRAVLAACAFRTDHGKLPSKLDDLVSAGLLESVPIDPFCDEPLRYSPDRRIVWSVGLNAVDDGGQSADGCGGWMQKDLVWEIPA